MFSVGRDSLLKLNSLDDRLVRILVESISISPIDFMVGCTSRDISEQKQLFIEGKTKTMNSLHLVKPKSHAVDIFPLKKDSFGRSSVPWNSHRYFYLMAGCVLSVAERVCRGQDWSVRWGGNFNGDENLENDSFLDLVHFELREKRK